MKPASRAYTLWVVKMLQSFPVRKRNFFENTENKIRGRHHHVLFIFVKLVHIQQWLVRASSDLGSPQKRKEILRTPRASPEPASSSRTTFCSLHLGMVSDASSYRWQHSAGCREHAVIILAAVGYNRISFARLVTRPCFRLRV